MQWQYKPNSGGIASFSSQSPKRLSNNYASLSKRNALFFPSREQRFKNLSTKLNADADVESEKNEDTNKNVSQDYYYQIKYNPRSENDDNIILVHL